MTEEELRLEALKMALTYVTKRNEIEAQSSNTVKAYFNSKTVVDKAQEFEYYLRTGKSLY